MKSHKPRQRAAAIRYQAEHDAAPRIVAKGAGFIAERIVACARENGVPIHEDPDLAAVLAHLDVNTEIPPNLYRAMAEVLAFVYRLNAGRKTP